MALTSPRLMFSGRLRRAAANGPAVKEGHRGRSVHLVQNALLDLGFSMPRSTGNTRYSPDGVYGRETVAALKQFQKRNRLKEDGILDKNTIQALDRKIGGFKHRVRLHFRSIALQNVPFHRSLADAQTIYAQYGIKMEFGSGSSLRLSPAQMQLFNRIDGSCNWTINSGEYAQLHSLGRPVPSNEILVYFVQAFGDASLLGCGGHATNRPAATVAARASRWDTAHEVGHVLLTSAFSPVHVNDRRNLMHPTASTFSTIPVLTNMQVARMRRSPCCVAI